MKHIIYSTSTILFLSGLISFSEFFRNEIFYSAAWISYYNKLDMTPPMDDVISVYSLICCILYTFFIFTLSGRYSYIRTFITTFFVGFTLQWLTAGNADINSLMTVVSTIPLFLIETILIVSLAYLFRKWEINYLKDKHFALTHTEN
ncbi:MAG: hypothetical protein ACRCX5_12090 [Bacteroidales bacterium]